MVRVANRHVDHFQNWAFNGNSHINRTLGGPGGYNSSNGGAGRKNHSQYQGNNFSESRFELEFRPLSLFLSRLSHAPLLAQIIFFGGLGGIAQSFLLGGGGFLLWHLYRSGSGRRWRLHCGLALFGCGLFAWGGTFWIITLS